MIKKNFKIKFTGERMIPKFNLGAAFYYEHLARYLFSSQFIKKKIILDIGCGAGYGSYLLSKYGDPKKIFAIDISKEAIDYAKYRYKTKNINYRIDDAQKLKSIKNKSIDVAISFELIEHLKNQDAFLTQVKRIIKNNGIFITSTPNKYTYPKGNPYHIKELSPVEFKKLLNKYFTNVILFYQSYQIAQQITTCGEKKSLLNEKFTQSTQTVFSQPSSVKNSQYLLAICSNDKLEKITNLSFILNKVDEIDFSQGILKYNENINRIIEHYKSGAYLVQSTIFYKVWQRFCEAKDYLYSFIGIKK